MLQLCMISIYILLIYGAKVKGNIINGNNIKIRRNKDKERRIEIDLWMTGIGIMQYNNKNKRNLINSMTKCIHNNNQ